MSIHKIRNESGSGENDSEDDENKSTKSSNSSTMKEIDEVYSYFYTSFCYLL